MDPFHFTIKYFDITYYTVTRLEKSFVVDGWKYSTKRV